MRAYPEISITGEMIAEARRLIPATKVDRTIASRIDTLTGHLGEFVFAAYFYGDWKQHRVGKNRGQADFGIVEIKTSAYPFSERLHLLVREDYARKRKPLLYVQIVIDVPSSAAADIRPGTRALLCGFAFAHEVDAAPRKDFGSKFNREGGYLCHYIPIEKLHPMAEFRAVHRELTARRP